jgi:pimeloyl-ACP methyl ester carboxylesterase
VIAWEESGTGPAIVFVHGITEDRYAWHSVVPYLEDGFRCVRLDLRGHGDSDDADDYGAFALAEDVATVVAEAGIDEPPLVVGHSLGGFVVTAYAASAPVRGVVNVDQPLQLDGFVEALQSIAPQLRGPEFHQMFDAIAEGLGVEALNDDDRAWADEKHLAARQEVVLGTWSTLLDSRSDEIAALIEPVLRSISAPYLAVHGSDPGPEYVAWLERLIPGATVEVWDGDAHYPHMVEPNRFAERLRAFSSP